MIPLIISLFAQSVIAQDMDFAPIPVAGTNSAFQTGIKEVSALLEAKKFQDAENRAKNLPSHTIQLSVSFTRVDPEGQRAFLFAVEKSFEEWKKAIPELKLSIGNKPQIKIEVTDEIDSTSKQPATLVLFDSPDPTEPALEAVLALTRLESKISIDPSYMIAETNYIIGQYLGLAQVPSPRMTMFRLDGFGARSTTIDSAAKNLAAENLAQAQILREHIKQKKPVIAAFPEGFLDIKEYDFGTILQGEPQKFQMEMVNRGKAPLKFGIQPDCSCFVIDYNPVVQPGETSVITVYMSTIDFQGPQDKGLFIYTNDSENSVTRVSVHGMIRPAYRLRATDPNLATYIMTPQGLALSYYLYSDGDLGFEPRKVSVNGLSGVATINEWEGEISDPEWFEGKQKRKGYRIDLLLSPSMTIGRNLVALLITTNSELFPVLGANFYVQKGVAANPKSIFFGDVDAGKVSQASIVLTGPNDDFKILSIESQDSRFVPKIEKIVGNEYRLTVSLNPGESRGTLVGSIIIKTNNPDSPELSIPVQAYVR